MSLSTRFSRGTVNDKIQRELFISGYCRQQFTLHSDLNIEYFHYLWIPPEIQSTILCFYGFGDEFDSDSKWKSTSIEIIENKENSMKACIKKFSGQSQYSLAFLRNTFSSGIHVWKFYVNNLVKKRWWHLAIGIHKTRFAGIQLDGTYFTDVKENGYGFIASAGWKTQPELPGAGGLKYAIQCDTGYTIEMIADLNDCTLSFMVNGTDYGKAFDIENTEYRAVVSLYDKGDQITLLSYN